MILNTVNGGKKALLQEKTVTPGETETCIVPDAGYDGLSKVAVPAYPNPVNISSAAALGAKAVTDNMGRLYRYTGATTTDLQTNTVYQVCGTDASTVFPAPEYKYFFIYKRNNSTSCTLVFLQDTKITTNSSTTSSNGAKITRYCFLPYAGSTMKTASFSGLEFAKQALATGTVYSTVNQLEYRYYRDYNPRTDIGSTILLSNFDVSFDTYSYTADYEPDAYTCYLEPIVPLLSEEKTVTPSKAVQAITPSAGKNSLSKVTVEAIPDEYVVPSGSKAITANGTVDVTTYASVAVDVPIPAGYINPSGTLSVTANGTSDVTQYASVSVNVPIPEGYIQPQGTKEITSNGTTDVTAYASVTVNVPSVLPQLYAPSVSLSNTILTVTPNSSNGAFVTSYALYVDGATEPAVTLPASTTSYDLTGLSLAAGDHTITLKSAGQRFESSVNSNDVTYHVADNTVIIEGSWGDNRYAEYEIRNGGTLVWLANSYDLFSTVSIEIDHSQATTVYTDNPGIDRGFTVYCGTTVVAQSNDNNSTYTATIPAGTVFDRILFYDYN